MSFIYLVSFGSRAMTNTYVFQFICFTWLILLPFATNFGPFFPGLCRGLSSIHRMNVVHRDLKSANCLVNKHWVVKICDFGLSRKLITTPMKDSSSAGTPEWMAPELIRNEPFTEKCDIFSLGVIMWELCTLKRPWEGIPSVQVKISPYSNYHTNKTPFIYSKPKRVTHNAHLLLS